MSSCRVESIFKMSLGVIKKKRKWEKRIPKLKKPKTKSQLENLYISIFFSFPGFSSLKQNF